MSVMANSYAAPVLRWYAAHARDLPWRSPGVSPWSVLVSEIMLQQTPVARVLPAHAAWLARWPTPQSLAAAAPGDAVRQWGRLGYPRRALWLHATATILAADHAGQVPASLPALRRLPGVGSYTAAAVASFAFGQRHAVLDTNVRRVLARLVRGEELPPRGLLGLGREQRLGEGGFRGRAPAGRAVVGRRDGTRRAGLHGHPAGLRRLPGRALVRLAPLRKPARPAAAARAALHRHRPPVPRPPPSRPQGG
jgi:endonuclease III